MSQQENRPMSQLEQLATPFPDSFIERPPKGKYGDYITHSVITQRLLYVVGPFSFEVKEIVRGHVAEKPATENKPAKPALENAIVGVIGKLTLEIDGRIVQVEDAGDCDQPHNWDTDGARLKDAVSDAIKRCAARQGVGLHLWAQDQYKLDKWLEKDRLAEGDVEPEKAEATDELDPDKDIQEAEADLEERIKEAVGKDEVVREVEEASKPGQPSPVAQAYRASTKKQWQRIGILRNELGYEDGAPGEKKYRKGLAEEYGVTSAKDLSEFQADELIKRLEEKAGKTSSPYTLEEPPAEAYAEVS